MENFRRAIEPDKVDPTPRTLAWYGRSTSLAPRQPLAVVYPTSTRNVQHVVEICRQHQVGIHPISRGCNWGYGDACPTTDHQVIVDLSAMNRIVEIDAELAYAVIEPGVSQGQLHRYLTDHDLPLWPDVSGAGHEASFVGNHLERGFGHTRYGQHSHTSASLQVVLGDGQIVETGLGRFNHAKAKWLYADGVGPSLDGLFSQSNFGIVTRMGLWLMPRPEAISAFFITANRDDDLEPMIERLAPLRRQGLIQSTVHLGNDLRLLSSRTTYPWQRAGQQTPLPEALRQALRDEYDIAPWSAAGSITGTAETVHATKRVLRRRLKPYRVHFINDAKFARLGRLSRALSHVPGMRKTAEQFAGKLKAIEPLWDNLRGIPTDEPLRGVAWRVRAGSNDEDSGSSGSRGSGSRGMSQSQPIDPRAMHAGVLFVSPLLPAQGKSARQVMNLIEPIFARFGFEPMTSFTMINERAMICVTNLYFDTTVDAEAQAARACYHGLTRTLVDHGFVPYRAGPCSYDQLIDPDSAYADLLQRLKHTFDPDGLISPGRYVRPHPAQG